MDENFLQFLKDNMRIFKHYMHIFNEKKPQTLYRIEIEAAT